MADVVDVFVAAATPRARRERPALFAARLRWADHLRAQERQADSGVAPVAVQGIGLGDRVHVELAPALYWRGTVVQWVHEAPLPGARVAPLLARVRLDAWPAGITPPAGFGAGEIVKRPRNRLWPLEGTAA